MQTKTCTKCGEEKPLDRFNKDKSKRNGRSRCKECEAEQRRRYREENPEKELEYSRLYREENREKIRERNHRYREENPEKELERHRRYYDENREKELERHRRYREENRDIINAKTSSHWATTQELSKALSTVPARTLWDEEEDALLMADNGMTAYQKAIHLGRTRGSCVNRIQTLKNLRSTTNV
ncbi:HNH endonuclease [Corynebacterium phage PSonyx]|nr:HNH endonuclease [Corynebacterium phage PSonyx]